MFLLILLLLTNFKLIETTCSCNYTRLMNLCTGTDFFFYNGHCFFVYGAMNNFNDSITACSKLVGEFSTSGMVSISSRIALFFTKTTFEKVIQKLKASWMNYRIGLMTYPYQSGSINSSDFIWTDNTGYTTVGPLTWNISDYHPSISNGSILCPQIAIGSSVDEVSFIFPPCSENNTASPICETICTGDIYPCGDCTSAGVLPDSNNVSCGLNPTTTKDPILSTNLKALSQSVTSPDACASCPGVMNSGKCYGIGPIKYGFTWYYALINSTNLKKIAHQTCRLATFATVSSLQTVTDGLLSNDNNDNTPDSAWIGMKSSCYCTINSSDFNWVGSMNQIIDRVKFPIASEVGLRPFESCVYARKGGILRNTECINQDVQTYIWECLCYGKENNISMQSCSTNMSVGMNPPNSCYTDNISTLGKLLTTQTPTPQKPIVTSPVSKTLGYSIFSPSTSETPSLSNLVLNTTVTSSQNLLITNQNLITNEKTTSQYLDNSQPVTKTLPTENNSLQDKEPDLTYLDNGCIVGKWTTFSECSASCGQSAFKARSRQVKLIDNNSTCPTTNETLNCNLIKCNPMSPTAQTVAKVMQGIGCSWLLGLCTACFVISILLRSWNINRFIHASQEISLILAHGLIALARNATTNFVFCTWVSIFIHYFFIVLFVFLTLEALQVYTLVTTVVVGKSYFSFPATAFIGWGSPILIVAITALSSYNNYVSTFSCWLNFGHKIAFATIVPIMVCCGLSAIMVETAGQRANRDFGLNDASHVSSARINQRSLLVVIPLQVAAWFVGQSAVYYQNIALFSTVFALNLALGVSICFFHVLANAEGRAFVMQKFAKFKRTANNKVNSTANIEQSQNVELNYVPS